MFPVHDEEHSMKKLKNDLKELGYHNIHLPDFRLSYKVPLGHSIEGKEK